MPRTASEYTEAIRSLLDETNGSITHLQARPRLKRRGFDLAVKPEHKSSQLSQVDEYKYDWEGLKAAIRESDMEAVNFILKPVFNSTGFDEDTQKAVIEELRIRVEFEGEQNNFNVTKNNYNLLNFNRSETIKSAKPSPSRKPNSTKNKRAVRAVTKTETVPPPKHKRRKQEAVTEVIKQEAVTEVVKRRGRPRKQESSTVVRPTTTELVALEIIEKLGGVSHAEERIAKLQAEATELINAIESLAKLAQRSDELQKRIRSAA